MIDITNILIAGFPGDSGVDMQLFLYLCCIEIPADSIVIGAGSVIGRYGFIGDLWIVLFEERSVVESFSVVID